MKLLSWNVNGLRALLGRNGIRALEREGADILCLQETKAAPEQVGEILPGYPHQFWNSAQRKGYAGTVVFSKIEPLSAGTGMGIPKHDREGRMITLELPAYWLVAVYTPNAGRGLVRLDYRMEWDVAFLAYLKRLEQEKPVVFCGDLNVAHRQIDLANPKANRRNAGFTDEEREGFSRILDSGFLDSFRQFNHEAGHYTWWSYMHNARAKNIGWRIDYLCLSRCVRPLLKEAFILPEIMGSDHCPVGAIIAEQE